jgi:DNA-binding transcriptional ArsR family regulator
MANSSTQHTTPELQRSEDDPVVMPELPPKLVLTTEQQLKALADPLRSRMLVFLQHQPATAKQIANRLGVVPGTVGHHLQVLEEAGLVQVVARRIIHGIVAKYYTRTARIFFLEFPPEVMGCSSLHLDFLIDARNELAEVVGAIGEGAVLDGGFLHVRLSAERAQVYKQRLQALLDDLTNEPPDPHGEVYGLCASFFLAPPALQIPSTEGPVQEEVPSPTDSINQGS